MDKAEVEQQLNALAEGSQEELVVRKEDFLVFLEVWNRHPQKKAIIGEAQLGGEVVYHLRKEEKKSL